jgi:hypothetical protein
MKKKEETKKAKDNTEGYPLYPASEDVYSKDKKEKSIDPEDITKTKDTTAKNRAGKGNEKDFAEDETGEDLDVPGSELDEKEENAGSEDEENNYYSLGRDDQNSLDEDKGE